MRFRPSALAYALIVLLVWAMCLGIVLGRVELFFLAVPIAVALLRAPAPQSLELSGFRFTVEMQPAREGDRIGFGINGELDGAPGPVEVIPLLPPILGRATRAVLMPETNGGLAWRYRLPCNAAGMLDLGVVRFRAWDRAGLWLAEGSAEDRVGIPVYPRAQLLRCLPTPRLTGAPFGLHPSRRVGDGTDFADIRPFAAGDRVKRINWPASLRTRRLQVNQFFTERSGDIVILFDSFSLIGERPNSSLDHCLRAAASLALSYLRQQDRVGLLEYGGWVRWTRPGTGPTHYARILHGLARVSINPAQFLHDLTRLPERMLPKHALILALTPMVDQRFAGMVGRLAEQGRDTVLLALRTDELSAPIAPRWVDRPLVRRLWLREREQQLRALRAKGVRAVNWSPTQPVEAALVQLRSAAIARRAA
jgi:uncharacterized protein (DUF58 family)